MPLETSTIISTDADLKRFCDDLTGARTIAIDTEFVAEHSYRPQLCIAQVAAEGRMAVIDAMAIECIQPFWELLASPGHETIVHAGRQEVVFCLDAIGRPPTGLWDVQLAAGLVGLDYPAGYNTLIRELLGRAATKTETRSDWRRRPLSQRQIDYALDDVAHLEPLRESLLKRLGQLDRLPWYQTEMNRWLSDLQDALTRDPWRRVAGSSRLSRRELAVVRELWHWRDTVAQQRDCVARRVLRDDLIVELARRKSADLKVIGAVRGLDRGDLKRCRPEIADAVRRAIELHQEELPQPVRRDTKPQAAMVTQFLNSALTSICRRARVAPALVGTVSDIRELVAYRLDPRSDGDQPPALTQGWRAEVVGRTLDDLLAGKTCIRIEDPRSPQPLTFIPAAPGNHSLGRPGFADGSEADD